MLEEELLLKWLQVTRIIRNDSLLNDRFMNKVTYNEVLVLASIIQAKKEYVYLSDILESTKMLKSQLNRTINSLEEKGLILRHISENDKRKQVAKITPTGESLIFEIKSAMLEVVKHFVSVMGKEDSQAFDELLTKIIAKQDDLLGN